MKFYAGADALAAWLSLPVRGAWIEIGRHHDESGRTQGRSPCGERGLKYHSFRGYTAPPGSLPVRGAWIEI